MNICRDCTYRLTSDHDPDKCDSCAFSKVNLVSGEVDRMYCSVIRNVELDGAENCKFFKENTVIKVKTSPALIQRLKQLWENC